MKTKIWKMTTFKLRAYLPFFIVASIFSLLPLLLVIFVQGWPLNHEFQQFFIRTYVWADHFRFGDLIPIWSSTDAYGYGTPLPLYYQKLFHIINAGLFILVDNVKLATVITLYLFMMTGIYGLRAALSYVVSNKYIINILPLIFPLTGYVITDWFVRGAMAEISAVVLVPWVIWWCLRILKTGKVSYWIILIFPALFYAHNAIALISVIFIVTSISILCIHKNKLVDFLKTSWKKCIICLISISLFVVPSLVLQVMMSRDFNPAEKIDDIYNINTSFQDPINYLFDRGYVWLQNWQGYTVQLDALLWVPVTVLTIILVTYRLRNKKTIIPQSLAVQTVIISLILYLFLQLEISKPIYETIHSLSLIQFPWRMLSIITPLLIICFAILIERTISVIPNKNQNRVFVFIPLVIWLLLYVALSPLTYENNVEKAAIKSYPDRAIYAGGEYLPITYGVNGELLGNADMIHLYNSLPIVKSNIEIRETTEKREVTVRTFTIHSELDQEAALPVSYSRYEKVFIDGKQVKTYRNLQDPRLLIKVPKGNLNVRIELPTVSTLVQSAFDVK